MFAAWGHQTITWTNVDLSSVRSSDIILQEIPQAVVTKISLKIILGIYIQISRGQWVNSLLIAVVTDGATRINVD